MGILKKIRDKTGTVHDLGDSRVDAFETELSGAEHNVPYSPAVLGKANAIEKKIDNHAANTANPHGVTKEQLGLANVENKSSTQIRSEITKENVTNALGYTPIDENRIGAANGVASLDAGGRIPASQIPGGFDNIDEYDSLADFPETGAEGKIYVAKDTNLTYRWTGTQYIEISPSLALGETATTAYRGDRGKTAYDHSQVSGDSTIHHTHANKELLDSYKQTEADLANAVARVHEHGNKAVLDGITAEKVSAWDSKMDKQTVGSESAPVYLENGIAKECGTLSGHVLSSKIGMVFAESVYKIFSINDSTGYEQGGVIIPWVGRASAYPYHGELHLLTDSNDPTSWSKYSYNLLHYGRTNYASKQKFYIVPNGKGIDVYVKLTGYSILFLAPTASVAGVTYVNEKVDALPTDAVELSDRLNASLSDWSAGSESTPVYFKNGVATEATGVATKAELEAAGNVVLTYNQTPTRTYAELVELQKQGKLWFKYNDYIAYVYTESASVLVATIVLDLWHIVIKLSSKLTWGAMSYPLQRQLMFDDTPTAGSENPVKSGGIKTAIDAEATARTDADTALGGRIDTVGAKGLTVKEIDGEQVICFE